MFGIFLAAAAVFGGEPVAGDASQLVEAVRRAAFSSRAALKSGRGAGVYREYAPDGKLTAEIPFEIVFRAEREYHLRLNVARAVLARSAFRQRLVVSDGSAAFFRDFNESLEESHAIQAHGPDSFTYVSGGIRNELPEATRAVVWGEDLQKEFSEITRLANGNIRARCGPLLLEASPAVGYNITHLEFWNKVRSGTICEADWGKDKDVWYVRRKAAQYVRRGEPLLRYEWRYDRFEANPQLSDELFSLAALSLKPHDAILDARSGRSGWHRFDSKLAEEERLATMAEQLEKMPPRIVRPGRTVGWGVRALIVGVNAAAVVAVAVLWKLARDRQRRRGR